MNLETALQTINYRITGGDEYCWKCWGENVRFIDSSTPNGESTITYDTQTLEVFEITTYDNLNKSAYRWQEPTRKEQYIAEALERNVNPNNAWDDVDWADVELEVDILQKTNAILNGLEYDSRIVIDIPMDDELFLKLSKLAHKKDITFNEMITYILKEIVE